MGTENIVVPAELYVGYSKRHGTEAEYLGFATYKEDNAAFRKRQGTVLSWSNAKDKTADTFDNKPREGYRMSKNVTHGGGWNDTTTWWRVVDPRGFEIEISSGNVAKLFQYTDILKGEIQGECVYGWDKGNGSKIVLLPVNSEIYIDSQKSTERHYAKSLNIKDLELGDWVDLKNGTKGTFMGKINYAYKNVDTRHYREKTFDNVYCQVKFASAYVIIEEDSGALYFVMTPKVINAKDGKTKYTKERVVDILNGKLKKKVAIHEAGSSGNPGKIVYFTHENPEEVEQKYVYKKLTVDDLRKTLAERRQYDYGHERFNCNRGHYYLEYHEPTLLQMKDGRFAILTSFIGADHSSNSWYGREADYVKYRSSTPLPRLPYPEWLDEKGPVPEIIVTYLSDAHSPEAGLPMKRNPHFRRSSYDRDAYVLERARFDDVVDISFVRLEHNNEEYAFKD
jgi:hypothetical protein